MSRVPSHSSYTLAISKIIYSPSHPREISPSSGDYATSELQQIRYFHQPTKLQVLLQPEHTRAVGQSISLQFSVQIENGVISTGSQQKGCSAPGICSHLVIPEISLPLTGTRLQRLQHTAPWKVGGLCIGAQLKGISAIGKV